MALNETRIDVLRGARKGHVQSALDDVGALSKLAKAENDPAHLVHVNLRRAQAKLAEQKQRLAKFNAAHPVYVDKTRP